MSEFVEECRREWKRLGVPDPIAGEMAADLAADLAEAEADGVSAEQVLGSGAFDPRGFAAAWASERGVIGTTATAPTAPMAPPPPAPSATQTSATLPLPLPRPVDRLRLRLPDAIFLAAVAMVLVAALALVSRRSGAGAVEPVKFDPQGPPGQAFPVFVDGHHNLVGPVLLLFVAIAGLVVWLRYRSRGAGLPRGSQLDDGVGGPG